MWKNLLTFVDLRDKDMTNLEVVILVIHVMAALTIIGMVMLQRGKGAEMGAGFGSGSSATVFGSSGSGNFLTKTTSIAAVLFFVTSFSLAYFARQNSQVAGDLGIPTIEQVEPTQGEDVSLPELDIQTESDGVPQADVPSDEADPDVPTVE
jgi:preprotein translocase subunit SecG|tara:strand:- start:2274 stop:2726 length:453 start_codon:yes stop_codon:yes gene_type:complete